MKGWIKLDRKIRDHWLWEDKPFSRGQAWIDMLLRASHKDNKVFQGSQLEEVIPGQFITSELKLMEAWGWSKFKLRKFLKVLEDENMIIKKSDHKKTTIFIVNWGFYQSVPTSDCTSENTTDRPQTDHRLTTIKNVKENKKCKEGCSEAESLQLTEQELQEIIRSWNDIPHTVKIHGITAGTKRFNELEKVLSIVGLNGVKEAIQSVKDSEYLARRGHVLFDNYMNLNVVQRLNEGYYSEDFSKKSEEKTGDGLRLDW